MRRRNHTPGPWAVNQSDVGLIGIFKPVAPGCIIRIADAFYDPSEVPEDSPNVGSHHMNAKLIAAAPELLDSLELTVRFIDSIMPQLGRVACDIGLLNQALITSRIAIAKAKGDI